MTTHPKLSVVRGETTPAPTTDPALSLKADPAREHAETSREVEEAIDRDPAAFVRWPYPDLHDLAGPLPPGELWFMPGFSGHGKTTLAMSLFEEWTSAGVKVMYVGLEMEPWILKVHWLCRRLARQGIRLHPGHVIKGKLNPQSPDALHNAADMAALLKLENQRLKEPDIATGRIPQDFGRLVPVDWLTQAGAQRLAEYAFAHEYRVIIIDHVDHVDASAPGMRDSYAEKEAVLRTLHNATREHGVTILATSQMNTESLRGDKLRVHAPPTTDMVLYGMLKRGLAHGMLAVFRPLWPYPVSGANLAQRQKEYAELLKAARLNPAALDQALIPDVMGVAMMKDRAYGKEGAESVCYLSVEGGCVRALPEYKRQSILLGQMLAPRPSDGVPPPARDREVVGGFGYDEAGVDPETVLPPWEEEPPQEPPHA